MSKTLTQHLRHTLIKAIIADVPQIDYDEIARQRVEQDVERDLPPVIAAALKDAEARSYIALGHVYIGMTDDEEDEFGYSVTFSQNIRGAGDSYTPSDDTRAFVREQMRLKDEQKTKINDLRFYLRKAFTPLRTVEKLIERYPEFEKYAAHLVEPKPLENPPVDTTSPIERLRAAGWPKPQ